MAIKRPSEMILNGQKYIRTIGDVFIHESKIRRSMKKKSLSNEDKKQIAYGILCEIKQKYELNSSQRCKIFATLYQLSLKEKKNVETI